MSNTVLDSYGNVLGTGDTIVGILTLNEKIPFKSPQNKNLIKYRKGRTILSKGIVERFSNTFEMTKIYVKWQETGETTRIYSDRVYKIEG
jgi:hypothetical protein